MFYHIVFISFHKDVSQEERERVLNLNKELGDKCGGAKAGIHTWKSEKNLDSRKGVDIIQMSIFSDKEAFERYWVHDEHKVWVTILKKVADWTVGDFILN